MFTFLGKPSCPIQIVPSDQTEQNNQNSDFLNLPNDVMGGILTKCDLTSIMNLMRVCRALYDFIHRSPPTAIAKRLVVCIRDKSVYFCLTIPVPLFFGVHLHWSSKNITLKIDNHENGCTVWRNRVQWFMKNKDFVSVACNYLNTILRWIGTINQFVIDYHEDREERNYSTWEEYWEEYSLQLPPSNKITIRVMDTIGACLKSRSRPMRVENLTVRLKEPYSDILNLFDPISLKTLKLLGPNKSPEFDVRRLENLKALTIEGEGSNPIRDFFHVKNVELTVESISKEEILEIKEQFMTSPTMESITIETSRDTYDQVFELFGSASFEDGLSAEWQFPTHTHRTFVCETFQNTLRFRDERSKLSFDFFPIIIHNRL